MVKQCKRSFTRYNMADAHFYTLVTTQLYLQGFAGVLKKTGV
jgi:hypothetical protein